MWRKLLIASGLGVLIALAMLPAILCENALHIPPALRRAPRDDLAREVAQATGSTWRPVEIRAADGAILRAWWFTPATAGNSAVILLHGVADTRMGMLGHARLLLQHGFATLVPDSRGHGVSGGDFITFGIRESGDVHRWADWLFAAQHTVKLYGVGQSMGAAILLESLPVERRFRAVVADCPFVTFEEISYDRLSQIAGLGRLPAWPIVQESFLYMRLAHGMDLRHDSPADVVRTTRVPILLIHGTADTNVPPRHSRALHAVNPEATRLWEVPGAGHVASISTEPEAYARTVVEWFAIH